MFITKVNALFLEGLAGPNNEATFSGKWLERLEFNVCFSLPPLQLLGWLQKATDGFR